MILLGSQVGTPAIWPAGSNFDTMRALKSMPLRYGQILQKTLVFSHFCVKNELSKQIADVRAQQT